MTQSAHSSLDRAVQQTADALARKGQAYPMRRVKVRYLVDHDKLDIDPATKRPRPRYATFVVEFQTRAFEYADGYEVVTGEMEQIIRLDKPELPSVPIEIDAQGKQARMIWIGETWRDILRAFIGREMLPAERCEVVATYKDGKWVEVEGKPARK